MNTIFFNIFRNREVSNAGWIVGCRIVQMLISLIVSVLTARFLGPDNYGIIGYATAFAAFFTSLCSLGIDSIIVKEFLMRKDEQGETLGTALVLQGCAGILSVVLIIGISNVADQNDPLTVTVVSLCSLSLTFRAFEIFKYWFQAHYRSKVSSIALLLAYVTASAYKLVLLILGKDVRWFALTTSVYAAFIALFLFDFYKRYKGPRLKFSLFRAKILLRESYHYILSGMMVAVYAQADRFMLKQMMGASEVGYYATATTVCAIWTFILQAIIDSIYPTIISLKAKCREAYDRKNRQLYAIVFYMSVFVSVIFQIFGGFVIRLLYGNDYLPSVMPLKIITWYTAFSYLGVARSAWVACERKQKYLKYIYFNAMLINILFNLIFIPRWGASGAAFASLITQMATGILLPFLIKDLRPNAILMLEAIFLRKTIK